MHHVGCEANLGNHQSTLALVSDRSDKAVSAWDGNLDVHISLQIVILVDENIRQVQHVHCILELLSRLHGMRAEVHNVQRHFARECERVRERSIESKKGRRVCFSLVGSEEINCYRRWCNARGVKKATSEEVADVWFLVLVHSHTHILNAAAFLESLKCCLYLEGLLHELGK